MKRWENSTHAQAVQTKSRSESQVQIQYLSYLDITYSGAPRKIQFFPMMPTSSSGLRWAATSPTAINRGSQCADSGLGDDLTDIYNRKEFYRVALIEFHRCQREGYPFTLALFDIDHFKAVNDTYGHPAGDQVLQRVVHMVSGMIRERDTWGRVGGEEFALLFPETYVHDALLILKAIRQYLQDYTFVLLDGRTISVTASIGMAESRTDISKFETLLQAADHQLDQAKTGGRNQVCADQYKNHNL